VNIIIDKSQQILLSFLKMFLGSKMASSEIVCASFSLLDIGKNVMLEVERVTPELTQKSTNSGRSRNRKLVSDDSALELE
jgi:hypothetical protein